MATPTSSYASVFMLATDQPVMALGGYQGWNRILTPDQLAALVKEGTVRFFYLNGASGANATGRVNNIASGAGVNVATLDATADLSAWVQSSCTVVSTATWQGTGTAAATTTATQGQQLYDYAAVTTK